jgi:hypothetical protein
VAADQNVAPALLHSRSPDDCRKLAPTVIIPCLRGSYTHDTLSNPQTHFRYRIRAPTSLRDRTALLGPHSNPASGRSSPFQGDPNGHRFADDLEGQNDEALDGLHSKVKMLKDVSECV